MALADNALVTLAGTKTFLGITDSSRDAVLEILINTASDYIEKRTGRKFSETDYEQETYDGTGTDQIQLKNYPVVAFTKLEVNNTSNNSDSWSEIPESEYWVDTETGIITKTGAFVGSDFNSELAESLSDSIFNSGKNRYRATYSAGYESIPNDLKYACMSLVETLLYSSGGKAIKSETLGDHSVSYEAISVKGYGKGLVDDIIGTYRDIPLAQ